MDNGKENSKNIPVSPINGQPIPTNGGRKKGVQNKATVEFKQGLNNLFEYATPQMVEWLAEIESPERRFEVLAKFADYLYPKLARQEVQNLDKDGKPADALTQIKVEFVSPKD